MLGLVFKDYEEYKNTLRGIDIDSIHTLVYYDNRGEPHNIGIASGSVVPKTYARYDLMPYFVADDGGRLIIEPTIRQALDIPLYGAWYHDIKGYTLFHISSDMLDPEEYISPTVFSSPFKFITPWGVDYLTVAEESVDLLFESYELQIQSDFWFYSDDVIYISTSEEYTEIFMRGYIMESDFWYYSDDVQYVQTSEEYAPLSFQPYVLDTVQDSDFWFYSDSTQYIQTSEDYIELEAQSYIQASDFWFYSDSVQYISTLEIYQELGISLYELEETDDWDTAIPDEEAPEEWGSEEEGDSDWDVGIPGDEEEPDSDWDTAIPDDTSEEDTSGVEWGMDTPDSEEESISDDEGDWDIGIPADEDEPVEEPEEISSGDSWEIPDTNMDWDSQEEVSWDVPEETPPVPEPKSVPKPEVKSTPEPVVQETPIWEPPKSEESEVESVTGAGDINTNCTEPVEKPKEIRKYLRMFPHSTRKDLVAAGFTEKVIKKAITSGKIMSRNGVFIPVE